MAILPQLSLAQTVEPSATEQSDNTEDLIVLSPFEVNAQQDHGYAASSSLAGSRLNTNLRDIAAAVQAITPEFMKDVGATNLQSLLVYTTSTEVGGVGGNFYGGDTWNKGYAQKMLTEPQTSTRIRGLNNADISRDFFPTDIPIDWYSLSRVDISRGPNAVLFGLGSPAGLINNTLKVPNMRENANVVEVRVDNYGSVRESLDVDAALVPGQLGLRVSLLNDEAKYRQDFTYNHDHRFYGALRWQPKLGERMFTQIDVQGEAGTIRGNRPLAGTAADFISSWFGPANRLSIPNDEYWTAPGFVEDLYASQTIGGQLWDDHPVSFFSNPSSGDVGLPGNPQAMLLRGSTNVNGGGWGSWVGLINPNWLNNGANPKNTAAYYANNPILSSIIGDYETQTGRTFNGFGQGMWPTQMLVDGPVAEMLREQNLVGPNKRESNKFHVLNASLTQSFWDGRVGLNFAYNKQSYKSGYENLMEGLWGMNIFSVDVNETLRGTTTPNPNYGRPFTIGEGRGGVYEKDRENWRMTGYVELKADDFFAPHSLLTDILGNHTFTGVRSSQRYESFDRNYALYRWDEGYIDALTGGNATGYATWRGIHYLGDSLLNTASMNDITGITGVRSSQVPDLTQNVRFTANGTWTVSSMGLLSSETDLDRLYDGASQGYDTTDSKVFVWQGTMLKGVLVPIFGWREDEYTRWNKPSSLKRDPKYNYVLPFSSDWNYDSVTPIYAKQQRRSWSVALHGRELMEWLGHPLPHGMDVTLLYNDSSSFRPSDTSVSVYNGQEASPSGETKDLSVMVSAFNDRVSLRVTKYKTIQHNTPYFGPQPDFGWNKANLSRTMDGMMWEIGAWAGSDPTKRVQPTPEWLVNKWMFGDSYDKTIASQPLPSDWRSHPEILNQPLRIRQSAVPGSSSYVAEGDINPDLNLAYVAPPLTADEVAYRTEWFKSRSDSEWSRPVDQEFWAAMGYARDYAAPWGGFWEPNAWDRPQNLRSLNDLESTGVEYELTANPLPNWRISINASKAEAVRSNVLDSWDAYIAANEAFWFDGGYSTNDTPATNYWNFKGYYDIPHTPSDTLGPNGRFGTTQDGSIYNPYFQAKATENQLVNELRKWHFNAVTNYSFNSGPLKGLGLGGAVRWQDRSNLGYYPTFDETANAWVIDLNNPISGPREINFDAWVSYERKLRGDRTWSVQLNLYNLFGDDSLIPTQANPDGTIAQVRIPAQTTWALTNTLRF